MSTATATATTFGDRPGIARPTAPIPSQGRPGASGQRVPAKPGRVPLARYPGQRGTASARRDIGPVRAASGPAAVELESRGRVEKQVESALSEVQRRAWPLGEGRHRGTPGMRRAAAGRVSYRGSSTRAHPTSLSATGPRHIDASGPAPGAPGSWSFTYRGPTLPWRVHHGKR